MASSLAARKRRTPGASTATGFSAEDVLAGLHRGFEMHRAEAGRRGQDDEVGAAVDRLLVGVEADELPLFRHVDGRILEQLVAVALTAFDFA